MADRAARTPRTTITLQPGENAAPRFENVVLAFSANMGVLSSLVKAGEAIRQTHPTTEQEDMEHGE